jgi:hypothetical protein
VRLLKELSSKALQDWIKGFLNLFSFFKAFIGLHGDQARKFSLFFLKGNLFEKKTLKSSNKIKVQGRIATPVL